MSQPPAQVGAPTGQIPGAPPILTLLSEPRLAAYRDLFKPNTDAELLGAYLWAQATSASLHPLVGVAEVVLRNAIHGSLSVQFSQGASTSYPWYDRGGTTFLHLRGKSLEQIEDQLCAGIPPIRKAIQPVPDSVVARVTIGFWPNVMESLPSLNAARTYTDVFPLHPHSKPQHWSHPPNRAPIVLRLKRLQDLRNRICHFEPVWKPHWLGVPGPSNWWRAVAGLRTLHTEMLELLSWCSTDAVDAYKVSFGWNWFNVLCTTHAVTAFMSGKGAVALIPSFSPTASPSTSLVPPMTSGAPIPSNQSAGYPLKA